MIDSRLKTAHLVDDRGVWLCWLGAVCSQNTVTSADGGVRLVAWAACNLSASLCQFYSQEKNGTSEDLDLWLEPSFVYSGSQPGSA